jgi:hypothetical protein
MAERAVVKPKPMLFRLAWGEKGVALYGDLNVSGILSQRDFQNEELGPRKRPSKPL